MFGVTWWKLGLLLGIGSWMVTILGPHNSGPAPITHRMSRSLATPPPVNLHPKTVTSGPSAQKPESQKQKPRTATQLPPDSPPPGVWRRIQNSSPITAIVFTPDRRTLICACEPHEGPQWPIKSDEGTPKPHILPVLGSLNFWNLRTGKLTKRVPFHTECDELAISPDGKTLIGACDDYTRIDPQTHYLADSAIQVWSLPSGKLDRSIMPNFHGRMTFSHNGKWVAVSQGLDVWLFDTRTWRRTRVLSGPRHWLNENVSFWELAFSSDDLYFAAMSWGGEGPSGKLAIWNTQTGKLVRHLGDPVGSKYTEDAYDAYYKDACDIHGCLAFVPQSKVLVCGESSLDLAQPHSGLKKLFKHDVGWVVALSTARRRTRLVGLIGPISNNETIDLWDTRWKKPIQIWRAEVLTDSSLQFSDDGSLLANVNDTEVDLWRIR